MDAGLNMLSTGLPAAGVDHLGKGPPSLNTLNPPLFNQISFGLPFKRGNCQRVWWFELPFVQPTLTQLPKGHRNRRLTCWGHQTVAAKQKQRSDPVSSLWADWLILTPGGGRSCRTRCCPAQTRRAPAGRSSAFRRRGEPQLLLAR